MSRFSPQRVRTGTQPSDLAAALQGAVSGYQGQRDRQQADLSREFAQNLQRGQALRQGITLDTPPEPETFGSAFAKAYRPAPEVPPTPAGPPVAGGYDPNVKDFQRIDPVTKAPVLPTMRSGGATYDPNVDIRQEMATARGKGELGLEMGQKGRSIRQKELEQALATVPGAPLGAAASEGAAGDWLGRPPSAPPLRLGDPGYVDARAELLRATGGGQNRPPTEVESKDYVFAGLMENAMGDIRSFGSAVRPEVVTAIRVDPTGLSKMALTDDEQMFVRAVREFTAAALRKESGAAIHPDEISDVFDRYVDTGFDRPNVREAKARARENYLNLLRRTSARARDYYDRLDGGKKPTTPAPTPAAKRPPNNPDDY